MHNDLITGAAPEYAEELAAGQRAALIATWLQAGRAMTTIEIARELAITKRAAGYLMEKLSAVLPVYSDAAHRWRWVGDGEE